jgi:hypothetical protein
MGCKREKMREFEIECMFVSTYTFLLLNIYSVGKNSSVNSFFGY